VDPTDAAGLPRLLAGRRRAGWSDPRGGGTPIADGHGSFGGTAGSPRALRIRRRVVALRSDWLESSPIGRADSTIAPVLATGVASIAAVGSFRYLTLMAFLALVVGVLLLAVGLLRLDGYPSSSPPR